jgi:hypothetical protein
MSESGALAPAALLRAFTYHGDLKSVRRLIYEGVDVNACDEWRRTALSIASRQGHLDIVEALLAVKTWIDPYDDYDTCETPLIAAAEAGHLSIVYALIAAGANPTIHAGVSQATAEFYARINGHNDISSYLQKEETNWINRMKRK